MAQKWALGSIFAATASSVWSYENQNEIAHFLWPQMPETSIPYPDGLLFPNSASERPRNNHSPWGVCMFPIVGVSSYYILKYSLGAMMLFGLRRRYRTGPTTPRWMGPGETFRVYSPTIVQHCVPFTISIPFATAAKIYRDGPGYEHDREFYRTGVEDPAWDFLKFEHPEPERPLLDHPLEILHVIRGSPHQIPGEMDEHPIGLEHPGAEELDDESMLTWYHAQLGINVEKVRELPKKWLKLQKDYNPYSDPDEPVNLPIAKKDKNAKTKTFKYDPKAFGVDQRTPVGRLPNYGVADGAGFRLPWSASEPGNPRSLGTSGGLLTQEEFFDPNSYQEKELRIKAGLDNSGITEPGLDSDGNPVEIAAKYADIIRSNATKVNAKELDAFALEKRKAKDDLHNPWQSYYYHPNSVVGRDIPEGARIQATNDGDEAWRYDSDVEREWIKTAGRAKWFNAETNLRKPVPASKEPVFKKPNNDISVQKWRESFQGTPSEIDQIKKMDLASREKLIQGANLEPKHIVPLPGYAPRKSWDEMQDIYEKQEAKYFHKNQWQTLPTSWFPYEVKGVVKNRHEYYAGRGAKYADSPHYATGEPAYDPNAVPAHPMGLSMSIQEAEDYYNEVQRDDREYAKKVAGSFQHLYGVPFPKFEQPDLYDDNMIAKFPQLAARNKRLELSTRYFNSLEDRIVNEPPLDSEPTLNERRLKQTTAQIQRNNFNPNLYRTSNQYRAAWQGKYPALKQLGSTATADQIEYVLSFAAPNVDYDPHTGQPIDKKKAKFGKDQALPRSHITDTFVRETVEQDITVRDDMARTLGQYETRKMKQRKEITPRTVLSHEEEYKRTLNPAQSNLPLNQDQLDNERRWNTRR